jgi:hypothetical protein
MSYSSTILGDGPIAYFRMDEASGTVAHDLTGNGHNATLVGGITLGAAGALSGSGDSDTAMLFNGSTGYLNINSTAINTTGWGGMTLESWVYLTSLPTYYTRLIANDYPGASNKGVEFIIAPASDGSGGYFDIGLGTSFTGTSYGTHALSINTWYHLVGVFSGNTLTVYVNGVNSGSSTASGSYSAPATTFNVGRDPNSTSDYLPGRIDEVAIYNYPLSSGQVTAHYIAATTPPLPPAPPAAPVVPSTSTSTQGGVQMLIADVWYPRIRQETITVDRTANDPIPTFKVSIQDDPSNITISELEEVIFIDSGQISNPTHNLLRNPTLTPFSSNWFTTTTASGSTFTQAVPGVQLSASNIPSAFGVNQITQNGLIVGGQSYMLSCFIQTTTLTGVVAALTISWLNATGGVITSQVVGAPTSTSNTRYGFSMAAPANATNAQVSLTLQPTASVNSGSATFTNVQFEPMSFAGGNMQMQYPTPVAVTGQPNCVVLPDATTIRQYRLFGGLITKATAGAYIGNNRQWALQVSGYAWLLQKQQLNNTYTNHTDAYIIGNIVTTYFPNQFSTAQVATGATLDNFAYAYNGTARDAFDALAANSNFYYYVDPYRSIIYQPPGYNQLSFMLSDKPDNVASYPYYSYSLDIDGTQIGNACIVTGATGISAIEYDAQSIGYYNLKTNHSGIFWRTVNDSTITTTAAARQRAIAENTQYNYARNIAHLTTNQLIIPGYTVLFSSATDDLYEEPMLIQKATLILKGFRGIGLPTYEFQCDLGSFNPDFVNITVKLLRKQLVTTSSVGTPVIGLMVTESMTFVDSVQVKQVTAVPSTYGVGVYGVSAYAFAIPSIPVTQYNVGTYGDPTKGYA